jgi:hypothetical protein
MLFVLAYIVAFLFIILGVFLDFPKETRQIDNDNSLIVCDNGSKYKAGENDIEVILANQYQRVLEVKAMPASERTTLDTVLLRTEESARIEYQKAASLCPSGLFTIKLTKVTVPSWGEYLGLLLLSIFGVIAGFELLKGAFFYVVQGKKMF